MLLKLGKFAAFAVLFVMLNCYSGNAVGPYAAPLIRNDILLCADCTPETNPEYKKVLRSMHSPSLLEKAKILYLISQLRLSLYRFERNGVMYDGRKAASHLMMKYGAVKNQVKTAEEFVNYIGSGSKKTGEPYHIVADDGTKYLSRDILMKELLILEEHILEDSQVHGSEALTLTGGKGV